MASASAGTPSPALAWCVSKLSEAGMVDLMMFQEASRLVVPIGALYTPLKEKPDMPLLQYEPVTCKAPCRAVLNPFAYVTMTGKVPFPICCICLTAVATSTFEHGYGSVLFAYSGTLFLPTTRISHKMRFRRSFTLRAQRLSIGLLDQRRHPRSSSTWSTPVRKRIA